MENLSAFEFCGFSKRGRLYGLFARVYGQAYVLGFTERGIFYRFSIKTNEYKPGKWEAFFGLRTRIGIGELMIKIGMKDETIPVHFRANRIRGSLHFSRTGVISFIGGSRHLKSNNEVAQQLLPDSYQTEQRDFIDGY